MTNVIQKTDTKIESLLRFDRLKYSPVSDLENRQISPRGDLWSLTSLRLLALLLGRNIDHVPCCPVQSDFRPVPKAPNATRSTVRCPLHNDFCSIIYSFDWGWNIPQSKDSQNEFSIAKLIHYSAEHKIGIS
jgi:hypothetical protein